MAQVALTVGGSVLSAVLQVLFDRMATKEFVNFFWETKIDVKPLENLKKQLRALEPLLGDADIKQIVNEGVKKWLDELQDCLYLAEDFLDKINTEALRVKVETDYYQCSVNQVIATPDASMTVSNQFLKEMMPKIQELVFRLKGFKEEASFLGLQLSHAVKRQSYRDPSTSLFDQFVYGRNVEKEKVIQSLLSDHATEDNIMVISLVGLGGIGKTTLAQWVYDDERVKAHFDIKAWVCVSDQYDALKITRELLEEFGTLSSGESFNALQVKLKIGLRDKKFLIVLDDVWTREYSDWNKLKISLGGGLCGSKIIVTTRDEKVALMMGKGGAAIHHLDLISKEDSWSLFKKHALENVIGKENVTEFEEIGKRIVEKCERLPLAVRTVAGLLRSKMTVEEWEDVLESEVWNSSSNPDEILPALRLSYNHLPAALKQCFSYCAVFPKGQKFGKEELIRIWLANDLLENPRGHKTKEALGKVYFHELRLRSLLQQSRDNLFFMHDLVNHLAKSVLGKYCHWLEDNEKGHVTMARVRNLSYHMHTFDAFGRFNILREARDLRTFLPIKYGTQFLGYGLSNRFLHVLLPTLKSLRFLCLSGYKIFQLPDAIGNLKQLRHLDLSFTQIRILPDWICTLYNLQSLLLTCCSNLKQMPVELGKLINLRYLDISEVPLRTMPTQIGRLTSLQVLSNFVLDKDGDSRIEMLGKFPNLQEKLIISGLENVFDVMDVVLAKMKEKKHLEDLILHWNGETNDSQVAADVLNYLQPHSSIKHIEIHGYSGTRFPNWLGSSSFSHMVSLSLFSCPNCFCLPTLGQLVSLQTLIISQLGKIVEVGREIYGDIDGVMRPFQSLKVLRIYDMPEWCCWFIPDCEAFTNLEELYIIDCPELEGDLPKHLQSLKKLEITGCQKLVLRDGRLSVFNYTPENLHQQFPSLIQLRISNMKNLIELSPDLQSLTSLQELHILGCPQLRLICPLPGIKELTIEEGNSLLPLAPDGLPPSLKTLEFRGCCNFDFQQHTSSDLALKTLRLHGCNNVRTISLGLFPKLKLLDIDGSEGMEVISVQVENYSLTSLQCLMISGCKNLKSLPGSLQSLLPSLKYLYLDRCPEIECFPQGGLPAGLRILHVAHCQKLMACRSQWGLQRHLSLIEFVIGGTFEAESFPEDWILPCSLEVLHIWNHRNLKMLNYGALRYLTSLRDLYIWDCPGIQSLPEEGLPTSVSHLNIWGCPQLNPRLEWQKGEDWPKVEHIGLVIIDREPIP